MGPVDMLETRSFRILHRINLNVSGGVENQFRAFVMHPAVRSRLLSEALIGSPVHPSLKADITQYTTAIHSFKRWGGLSLPRWPRRVRSWRTGQVIRKSCPDAVLSWSAFAKTELADACRRYRVPLLYREGGGAWGEAEPRNVELFLAAVTGAFCNTRASMRMLQLKWGYQGDAVICLGGVRPDLLQAARQEPETGVRSSSRRSFWRIGMAARLVHEKGICLGLHTLKVLRDGGLDVELKIAGYGEEEASLKKLSENLGVDGHVSFLGSVSDMGEFYRGIDVLLHPALQEPLGNSTIEASAFGCPVVASRVDGLGETVVHGVTGYNLRATESLEEYPRFGGGVSRRMSRLVYDPDTDDLRVPMFTSPVALAEALDNVLTEEGVRTRMGQAARDHVMTNFSYDRHVESILDGITRCLS